MSENRDCKKCDDTLTKENTGKLWFKDYCKSCWPNECPVCGETENYFYSLQSNRLECDQGCHFNYDGDLALSTDD